MKMVPLKNSLKIADSPYITSLNPHPDLPMMHSSPTTLPTSTTFHHHLAYLGNDKKICRLTIRLPTLASCGTWPLWRSPYHHKRSQNTSLQYRHGTMPRLTPLMKSKSYMENYFTAAQLFQEATLFLPSWKPCWGSLVLILSTHYIPQKTSSMALNGGLPSSANLSSAIPFPDWLHSWTVEHSLM